MIRALAVATLAGVLLVVIGVLTVQAAGAGLRVESVRMAGVPVEVVRAAGDDATGRPAVVVAHGYAGSGRLMRPFADTLARRGYLVALPDLAGHAASPRRLTGPDAVVRDLVEVVRRVRGRADVDPGRVALLGHSMGASAVVRTGAADQAVAATVAISLGDQGAAQLRPGPRRLLVLTGALEPPGLQTVARDATVEAGGRAVTVPLAEHVGVLYADRTHREAARWLDAALGHQPRRPVIEAKLRLAGAGLTLVGTLLLAGLGTILAGVLTAAPAVRQPLTAKPPAGWLIGSAVAALAGLIGGWVLARGLPSPEVGALVGYFGAAGAALVGTAAVVRLSGDRAAPADGRPQPPAAGAAPAGARIPDRLRRPALATVALVGTGAGALVGPIQLGLTSVVPYGPRVWLTGILALAVAGLLVGAQTLSRPPWNVVGLVVVCLPLPFAAGVGLVPGFLVIVAPLVAALFLVHLGLAAIAWLTGTPLWRTIPAGAVMVAWPVASALPLT